MEGEGRWGEGEEGREGGREGEGRWVEREDGEWRDVSCAVFISWSLALACIRAIRLPGTIT